MGGYGSGPSGSKKSTVEDSLVLAIGPYFERQSPKLWSGTSRWLRNEQVVSSLEFQFELSADGLVMTLHYSVQGEAVRLPIMIQKSVTPFGGARHWFTCPLRRNGIACLRRCHKLYAAPGSKYFGCRHCNLASSAWNRSLHSCKSFEMQRRDELRTRRRVLGKDRTEVFDCRIGRFTRPSRLRLKFLMNP